MAAPLLHGDRRYLKPYPRYIKLFQEKNKILLNTSHILTPNNQSFFRKKIEKKKEAKIENEIQLS